MQRLRVKARVAISVLGLVGAGMPTGASSSINYGYDPVGRLTTARYDNGLCIVYAYDQNGNRISQINSTNGTGPTWGSGTWGCFIWTAP